MIAWGTRSTGAPRGARACSPRCRRCELEGGEIVRAVVPATPAGTGSLLDTVVRLPARMSNVRWKLRGQRVAQADADLGEVLRRGVRAGDIRLLHAEAGEDVRRELVARTDLVDQRSTEAAIDAEVIRRTRSCRARLRSAGHRSSGGARGRRRRSSHRWPWTLTPPANRPMPKRGNSGRGCNHRDDAGRRGGRDRVVRLAVVRRHIRRVVRVRPVVAIARIVAAATADPDAAADRPATRAVDRPRGRRPVDRGRATTADPNSTATAEPHAAASVRVTGLERGEESEGANNECEATVHGECLSEGRRRTIDVREGR